MKTVSIKSEEVEAFIKKHGKPTSFENAGKNVILRYEDIDEDDGFEEQEVTEIKKKSGKKSKKKRGR